MLRVPHGDPGAEVQLDNLRRTEGASDPDDMAAIAAVVCPHCGPKGTLVLQYGAEATPEENEVLARPRGRPPALSQSSS